MLLYTDPDKEFDNDLILQYADRYRVTLHFAPSTSWWPFGRVVRHDYQLRHPVELIMDANDMISLQDACDVACMAMMAYRRFLPQ